MKQSIHKLMSVILSVLLVVSLLSACSPKSPDAESSSIRYSNLASDEIQKQVSQMMNAASISADRQKVFFDHVEYFNSIVKAKYLAKDFESWDAEKCKYDPYDLQDEWNERSPDFMGYNCRITAFGLFRDLLDISLDGDIRNDMILLDLVALEEDSSVLLSENDFAAFSVLYSTIPTVLTKDINPHVENLQRDWEERGIRFMENEHASLISVVFHESLAEDDNYLFIGHIGILFEYEGKLFFVEKLAFQEPYQVTEFEDRNQLNDYLMTKYDLSFDQPTAAPFIMENDQLMDGYRSNTQ